MAADRRSAINSSATHVFQVLRLVSEAEEPLGVSEISRRLGLPASTVYRALITLEESDYIVRYQNMPRYELGPMPQLLNRALVHRFKLHAHARPVLRTLAERTGETASLTVRLGWYGLRLAGVYGSRDIYHRDRLGEVALLHRSLPGRGILAFLGDDERTAYRAFVEAQGAPGDTVDWPALDAQLAAARNAGLDHEVLTAEGLARVALPVRSPDQGVIASIAINGPIFRPGGDKPAEGLWAQRQLEAEIAAAPQEFRSPFAHMAADEIVIRTSPPGGH